VTQGTITLKVGGTVYGPTYYSSTSKTAFSDTPSVHYVNATRPTAATIPSPIDFANASIALLLMSQQLNLYDTNGTTTPSYNSIIFTGTDTELNVFKFPSSYLTGTTVFTFKVPPHSAVIINVTGGTATFTSAGYSSQDVNNLHLQSVLWNFPSATQLQLSSTSIPGSILAPQAAATLANGSLDGTVVAKSASLNVGELDWNPYQVPSSTGCLSTDASWSCSKDTAIDDTGQHAAAIKAEAGFLDLLLDNYIAEGVRRASPEHRIWYSFQPAATTPKSKPLAVFFNGGPGSSTSAMMFSFNTAPWTLDPDPHVAGNAPNGIAPNPSKWTKFANLLYIDAPATGFSYPLGFLNTATGTVTQPDIGTDMDRDAGIFLDVIVRFLMRHPALLGNRVILVGESYGGTRATLMLHYLYYYYTLIETTSAYQDVAVSMDLVNYFQAAFKGQKAPTSTQIATRFNHQVLISPAVAGWDQQNKWLDEQQTGQWSPPTACSTRTPTPCFDSGPTGSGQTTPSCDIYDCDKAIDDTTKNKRWIDYQISGAADSLTASIATLNAALGVDSSTIEWMRSTSRAYAYGRGGGISSQAMKTAFDNGSSLVSDDSYFLISNTTVADGYGYWTANPAGTWNEPPPTTQFPSDVDTGIAVGSDFLENVIGNVRTFITASQYDTVIHSPSIAGGLSDGNFIKYVSSVAYNATANPASLPVLDEGGMTLYGTSTPPVTLGNVTMPTYVSGHTVTMRAPAAASLLADVMLWYSKFPN
jgi:choice-of-anchor A domain-containing protein